MIDTLRIGMLHLHKQLVDHVKSGYEQTHGSIAGPSALFKLLVEHPAFQWLRTLSETIVAMDEALETDPPASEEAIKDMLRGRLYPEKPNEFTQRLEECLNANKDIKDAYNALEKHLQ